MSQLKYWDPNANSGNGDWVDAVVGAKGDTGQGVIDGGTDGQLLAKNGVTPYATKWIDNTGVPSGGSVGQVLTKNSTSYGWSSLSSSNTAVRLQSLLDHAKGVPAWNVTSTMSGVSLGYKTTAGLWRNNQLYSSVPGFITSPNTVAYNSIKCSTSVTGSLIDTPIADSNNYKRQVRLRGCIPYSLTYSDIPQSSGQLTNSTDTFYANASLGVDGGMQPSNYANRLPYWVEFDYYGSGFAIKLGSAYAASYPLKKPTDYSPDVAFSPGVTGFSVDYVAGVWVWVDGVPVTPTSIPFNLSNTRNDSNRNNVDTAAISNANGTTLYRNTINEDTGAPQFSDNQTYYYGVSFDSVAQRRIRIMVAYMDYGGLVVGPYDTVSPTDVPSSKVVIYGDSWTRGNTNASPYVSDMYPVRLGESLNAEYFMCGIGGTGYRKGNSTPVPNTNTTVDNNAKRYLNGFYSPTDNTGANIKTHYASPARMKVVTLINPDLIFVCGSVNDGEYGGGSGMKADAAAFYSNFPNTPIIASMVQSLVDSSGYPDDDGFGAVNQSYKDAALESANVIGIVDTMTSNPNINSNLVAQGGIGNTALRNIGWINQANVGTHGNNKGFLSKTAYGDGHPTQAGNIYWANRHYNEIVSIITKYIRA